MIKLYQMNNLTVCETGHNGSFVDGGESGTLPLRDAPINLKLGEQVQAFVYNDVSDNIIATMARPYAQMNECAYLEVVSTGDRGTFLDWGLPKDLLLPRSEQFGTIRKGDFYVVHVHKDKNERPIASMKLHRYLNEQHGDLSKGNPVDLMIASETELGFKAIINNTQLGLIFHEEISQPLSAGMKLKGWVRNIRDDGKINLNINALDTETRDQLEKQILDELQQNNGRLNLSDKSTPEDIYELFKVSKKNFKRALGHLYKKRLIKISPEFIELLSNHSKNE